MIVRERKKQRQKIENKKKIDLFVTAGSIVARWTLEMRPIFSFKTVLILKWMATVMGFLAKTTHAFLQLKQSDFSYLIRTCAIKMIVRLFWSSWKIKAAVIFYD
ncbi:hypothetical protein BJK05_04250 [Pectobacterium polaris]|nr:hypothetical protein BJK05_04250 [Pectobacterium polaris]